VSDAIPQVILDSLTDVAMPRIAKTELASRDLALPGISLPMITTGALVVGSGAAGLRAAVELARRGQQVLVASMSLFGGTSACSGSDKQTLHTAGTSRSGDDFLKLAAALGAGGCMDLDTAYVEAVGSLHTLGTLQYLGLPLPLDRFGAVLRYRTDHDEVGRATSCGPRTSRLMVKVLAEEAVRLGVPFLRKCEVVRILTDQDGGRVVGVLAIDSERRDHHHGLLVIRCHSLVLANGGPGELYRDSVYPPHCYGGLGLALEAGIEVTNLSESQFGIGTRRSEFPWNLSGTYVQVMPHIFSRGEDGREHNFLADYYRTTREMASNIFRKGYQWPFHASRMLGFGSSLVDLAIHVESRQGRTVFMDFTRDPLAVPADRPFALTDLDSDVHAYLASSKALLASPIDRLRKMNPLAIELYRMHGYDLARDPLPFNVNNQHMNGGVAVDTWNESSLRDCYAIGEVAGTHGVTRPGGAALNAGQVAGLRCAEQIRSRNLAPPAAELGAEALRQLRDALAVVERALGAGAGAKPAACKREIQARMSDYAGYVCRTDMVAPAAAQASRLRTELWAAGTACRRAAQLIEVFRLRHLALASEAVLRSLAFHIERGGGSRGARAYCAPHGGLVPSVRQSDLEEYRFLAEDPAHRQDKLVLKWDGGEFTSAYRLLRGIDDIGGIFFEKDWGDFLTAAVCHPGYRHR
jgi:succinate dehydrogenase / fumarate reductase, flavoprotein subunit